MHQMILCNYCKFSSLIFPRAQSFQNHLAGNVTCTLLYSITHPNPLSSKRVVLINIHSSSCLFNVLPLVSLILCPSLFSLRGKDWFVTLAFLSSLFLCHTDSFSPNIQQLMRCMRKMSAHILILKSKAIEMSSERFRSVKCNENIFVWKCHNQHSCALRTVWEKKTEGRVRCIALRHQSFLLHMALTDFLRSSNVKCASWNFTGSHPTATVHYGAGSFIFETNWFNSLITMKKLFSSVLLDGFRFFPTSLWPPYGTKEGQSLFE